jgi:hypothetical protein
MALGLMESVMYRALPLTIGQLSTFRFDGIATPNPIFERQRPRMAGIARTLNESFPGYDTN